MLFVYKEADCLRIGGGSMCSENPLRLCILLLQASVFICCTNERNKSFRGASSEGEIIWWRTARARLKWGLPNGQLPRGWWWEQKTARMMEAWPCNLFPLFFCLSNHPFPTLLSSGDDRWLSLSLTSKALATNSPPASHTEPSTQSPHQSLFLCGSGHWDHSL